MHEHKERQQYVTFSLAGDQFAVEVGRSREILDLVPITRVPQTPDYMLGVINLRGRVVPVLDLRRKLGLAEREHGKDNCIIVLEICYDGEPVVVGALADQVQEVIELGPEQIEPTPRLGTRLHTDFIRGIGRLGEQFLILLDIDRIFSGEELASAGSFEAEEAEAIGA